MPKTKERSFKVPDDVEAPPEIHRATAILNATKAEISAALQRQLAQGADPRELALFFSDDGTALNYRSLSREELAEGIADTPEYATQFAERCAECPEGYIPFVGSIGRYMAVGLYPLVADFQGDS